MAQRTGDPILVQNYLHRFVPEHPSPNQGGEDDRSGKQSPSV